MDMKNQLIVSGIIATLSIMTAIGIYEMQKQTVSAEINKTDSAIEGIDYKVFIYGKNPEEIMSLTNAQYSISGFPISQVFISNWDKLTPLEQSNITTGLNAMGYFEQDKFIGGTN